MSINSHLGHSQSRRDDMESLGYMLMNLCGNCPIEFRKIILPYFLHVQTLGFEEAPNYDYLRKLFLDLYNLKGFKNIDVFDWNF